MRYKGCTLVLSALLAGSIGAQAQPGPSHPANNPSCFFVNQFQNWRAPDARTIYVRVNIDRYYRLDLSRECPALRYPGAHLIMNVRGPSTICSAVDWDLKVNMGKRGISEPCIVRTMTPLTPAEAAAIPKRFKP